MLRFQGILAITVCLLLVGMPAEAEIYLKKSDTGTIQLTDQRVDDSYQLVLESKIPEDYELPSRETLEKYVEEASDRHDIPKTLIFAVITVESNGSETARSDEGAMGLMQLMPATAESLGVEDPLDPRQNILGGSLYLKKMLNRFDGDLTRSIAAYNAGPGAVEKHNGIPPYEETQQFVKRVEAAFGQFKRESDMIYTYYDENGVLNVTNIQ